MKKFSALLLAILMISALFLVTGCGGSRDENLVGRWVWEDAPDFVTTFNEDGTGSHAIDWGFGTTFEWTTPGNNIRWNYPNHPRMDTPYNIQGDVLTITLEDEGGGAVTVRYIRD